MNISYNWLRELTGTAMEPRVLADRLTMVGLAVEGVHEAGDDFVLDFDLTSNRPDCLSHLGVARELAVLEGIQVRLPEAQPAQLAGSSESFTAVEIRDVDLCPRYAARVVRGVRIKPSPDWLVKRLEAIGQRPINNVADSTNYVLHELGQPLHAFDLAKLVENRIVVRRAAAGEKIRTLDGVERELDVEMLVIADAARAVAVAGVMGGEETEISNETRDVLIESAYFAPASVRRTARILGLHTEASHRFERGVDYEGVRHAQDRCVALICELAGGTATEDAIDVYPQRIEQPRVSLRPARVEGLTGLRVSAEIMNRILTALGFARAGMNGQEGASSLYVAGQVEAPDADAAMTYVAPTWRVDIELEEDLVEEVARHIGYDKIATELPASTSAGEYQPGEARKRALGRVLTAYGFDEAISFSFIDQAHDDRFEFVPELMRHEAGAERFVTLSNSIIEGATRMRPTLLPGLLSAVRHNFNHGMRDVRLFETGRIFAAHPERGSLPDEREAFALVATGAAIEEGRAGADREVDFYDLKGALEAVADAMKLPPLYFAPASVKHLHEGQAAIVGINEQKPIGTIGRLTESVAAAYKFRQPVYVAEVDLSALLAAEESVVRYRPLPRYPSVVRDVSVLADRRVTFAEMLRMVFDQKLENLRDAKLVGVYEGANIPEGKRSVTLRIEYRADERTLRDEEVDALHALIVKALAERFGAQLRG